jgi:hypothetical protein
MRVDKSKQRCGQSLPGSNSPPRSNLEDRVRLALGLCALLLLVVLLLRLLLPWVLVLGLGVGTYLLWQRWLHHQQQQQTQLNQAFYQLLQTQNGRISVLDLAMQTQISGPQARDYLDAQARAFSANFEPTPDGNVLYVFNLGNTFQSSTFHQTTDITHP